MGERGRRVCRSASYQLRPLGSRPWLSLFLAVFVLATPGAMLQPAAGRAQAPALPAAAHCSPGARVPPVAPCFGGVVSYPAGWNLLAGYTGMYVFYIDGPLYTLGIGGRAYEAVATQVAEGISYAPLQPGLGYWAYLSQPTAVSFPHTSPQQPLAVALPPGQYVMIGNPFADVAAVAGADVVYTYDAASGYTQTTSLQPGQGAFAYSSSGGMITISRTSPQSAP